MSFIKNTLATIGLLSLILIAFSTLQIKSTLDVVDTFDEKAIDIYSRFIEKTLATGSPIDAMIIKVKAADGLTTEDLQTSIRTIANELNIKNVGELPLSEQVESMTGQPYRYVKIYLLCNAMTAASMLNYNDAFASFLPCRITVIEDEQGALWLSTMDLNLMIHGGKPIPPALKSDAIKIRDALNEIMLRSAAGDF
jgi:Domain of unknown function DUF302